MALKIAIDFLCAPGAIQSAGADLGIQQTFCSHKNCLEVELFFRDPSMDDLTHPEVPT